MNPGKTKQKNWKKILIVTASGLLILILSLTFFIRKRLQDSSLVSPKRGAIVEAIYGLGTVTPRHKFNFKVGQVKTIQKLYVQEGDDVKKGQLLVELADGIRIHAPFNGTVTSLPFNSGENVFQDTAIVTIEDMNDLYITANLEQQGVLRVKKGLQVKLNFESIRDQNFEGIVSSVFAQKGQFIVHMEVKNLPKEILPGMTADASIEVAKKENVLLIPILSVSNGKVLLKRNGKTMRADVKIGSMDNEWAEILDGSILETDQIVVKK